MLTSNPIMTKATAKSTLSVCLFYSHLLVVRQLEELLKAPNLRLIKQRLPARTDEILEISPANLYLVDTGSAAADVCQHVFSTINHRAATPMMALGDNFTEENAFPLLRVGVKGLLNYQDVDSQLLRAVQAVSAGGYWVPRQLLSRFVDILLLDQQHLNVTLSNSTQPSSRERQVLDGLLQNFSNKEIANKLRISERTVKFHVSNLLVKFRVQRRADLMLLWFQRQQTSERSERDTSGRVM